VASRSVSEHEGIGKSAFSEKKGDVKRKSFLSSEEEKESGKRGGKAFSSLDKVLKKFPNCDRGKKRPKQRKKARERKPTGEKSRSTIHPAEAPPAPRKKALEKRKREGGRHRQEKGKREKSNRNL